MMRAERLSVTGEGVTKMRVSKQNSVNQLPSDYKVEKTSLDLEAVSNNYTGLMKIRRLLYIAKHCPWLAMDATQLALDEVKSSFNIGAFQDICTVRSQISQDMKESCNSPEALNWIEDRKKQSGLILETLDKDLKSFRSHSIKESIRRGYDDLGDHYMRCGDLSNAFKCYSRAKDYCISNKHFYNLYLNIIIVSIFLENWSTVINYYNKADSYTDASDRQAAKQGDTLKIKSKLLAAVGLAEMCSMRYKSAARYFLQLNLETFDFPEILSTQDVAVYGGLCALVTFDRTDLNTKVIYSNSFKEFLELQPTLRDAIGQFYESKYTSCLASLEKMRGDMLLDPFLAHHVAHLLGEIRRKALVQYFTPYSSVDMEKMAASFKTNIAELEEEVSSLILEGRIQGRIDSNEKILYSKSVDQRMLSFKQALEVGQQYKQQISYLILRANIMKYKVSVSTFAGGPQDQEADL